MTTTESEGSLGTEQAPRDEKTEYLFGAPPTNLPAFEPAPSSRVAAPADVRLEVVDLAERRDRRRFLDMADELYRGDPLYIAPLRMDIDPFLNPRKNPAFDHLEVRAVLAIRNDRVVGRITGHVDTEFEKHVGKRVGFFGFFESVNDPGVAHALLGDAIGWLSQRGCSEVFGPANFTFNHRVGLLVENFSRPPVVEQLYNPRYYEGLLTSFGLGKAKDLFVYWIDLREGLDTPKRQRVKKIVERVAKKERAVLKNIDVRDPKGEIDKMYDVYHHAWEKNWGFGPATREEFQFMFRDMKLAIHPDLIMFLEVDGKAVGFSATLPNVNEVLPKNGRLLPFGWLALPRLKNRRTGRLITLGMAPEYRRRGLEGLFFVETVRRCREHGIMAGEIGWTLEDNHLVNRAVESMDGFKDRVYRILGMTL